MKKRNFLMFFVTILFLLIFIPIIYIVVNYNEVVNKLSLELMEWIAPAVSCAVLLLTMIATLKSIDMAIAMVINIALCGIAFGIVILTENLQVSFSISALQAIVLYFAVAKYVYNSY